MVNGKPRTVHKPEVEAALAKLEAEPPTPTEWETATERLKEMKRKNSEVQIDDETKTKYIALRKLGFDRVNFKQLMAVQSYGECRSELVQRFLIYNKAALPDLRSQLAGKWFVAPQTLERFPRGMDRAAVWVLDAKAPIEEPGGLEWSSRVSEVHRVWGVPAREHALADQLPSIGANLDGAGEAVEPQAKSDSKVCLKAPLLDMSLNASKPEQEVFEALAEGVADCAKAERFYSSDPNIIETVGAKLSIFAKHFHDLRSKHKDMDDNAFFHSLPGHIGLFCAFVSKVLLEYPTYDFLPSMAAHWEAMGGICAPMISPFGRLQMKMVKFNLASSDALDLSDLDIDQKLIFEGCALRKQFMGVRFVARFDYVKSSMKDEPEGDRLLVCKELLSYEVIPEGRKAELLVAITLMGSGTFLVKAIYLMDAVGNFGIAKEWGLVSDICCLEPFCSDKTKWKTVCRAQFLAASIKLASYDSLKEKIGNPAAKTLVDTLAKAKWATRDMPDDDDFLHSLYLEVACFKLGLPLGQTSTVLNEHWQAEIASLKELQKAIGSNTLKKMCSGDGDVPYKAAQSLVACLTREDADATRDGGGQAATHGDLAVALPASVVGGEAGAAAALESAAPADVANEEDRTLELKKKLVVGCIVKTKAKKLLNRFHDKEARVIALLSAHVKVLLLEGPDKNQERKYPYNMVEVLDKDRAVEENTGKRKHGGAEPENVGKKPLVAGLGEDWLSKPGAAVAEPAQHQSELSKNLFGDLRMFIKPAGV